MTPELCTLLAALRLYQDRMTGESPGDDYADIASNGGRVTPLDADGIDALCERLNTASRPLIVISISGGCLSAVHASQQIANLDVQLFDFDDAECDNADDESYDAEEHRNTIVAGMTAVY